ncbi:MAG: peptidoglycan-binding domain-containing protein [Saprospiraceae bacterium]
MKSPTVHFFTIVLALTAPFCVIQQPVETNPSLGSGEQPNNPKPGSCYAKCIMYTKSDTVHNEFRIISTGMSNIEWREVLCGEKAFVTTIRQIQEGLKKEGYYQETADGEMNARTKAALTKYQRDKGLPVGNLDFETLDSLNIRY